MAIDMHSHYYGGLVDSLRRRAGASLCRQGRDRAATCCMR